MKTFKAFVKLNVIDEKQMSMDISFKMLNLAEKVTVETSYLEEIKNIKILVLCVYTDSGGYIETDNSLQISFQKKNIKIINKKLKDGDQVRVFIINDDGTREYDDPKARRRPRQSGTGGVVTIGG